MVALSLSFQYYCLARFCFRNCMKAHPVVLQIAASFRLNSGFPDLLFNLRPTTFRKLAAIVPALFGARMSKEKATIDFDCYVSFNRAFSRLFCASLQYINIEPRQP